MLRCECSPIGTAEDDELARLEEKARHRERAQDLAYAAIGSVLSRSETTPRGVPAAYVGEPVLRVCQMAARRSGIDGARAGRRRRRDESTFEDRVGAIAAASGFQTRLVALRDDWWRTDHGPLIGAIERIEQPVALLPIGAAATICSIRRPDRPTRVDAAVAAHADAVRLCLLPAVSRRTAARARHCCGSARAASATISAR